MSYFKFTFITVISLFIIMSCNSTPKVNKAVQETLNTVEDAIDKVVIPQFDPDLWNNTIKPEMQAHLKFRTINLGSIIDDEWGMMGSVIPLDEVEDALKMYVNTVNNFESGYQHLDQIKKKSKDGSILESIFTEDLYNTLVEKVPQIIRSKSDYQLDDPVWMNTKGERQFFSVYNASTNETYQISIYKGSWNYDLTPIENF